MVDEVTTAEDLHRHIEELKAHRPFRNFIHPRLREDGEKIYAAISGKPVFDEAGRFQGYRGSGTDVTEHRRAEEALRASEATLAEAQRLAKIGHWHWSIETDRLVSCSEEYARLHGVSMDRIHEHLEHQMENVIHPEDRARVATFFRDVDERGVNFEIEYKIVRTDGEVRYVQEMGQAVINDAGRPIAHRGTVQDITERRVAEAALRESQARLKDFFDHSPAALSLKDKDERYILVNPRFEETFGRTSDQIMGRTMAEVGLSAVSELSAAHDRAVLRSGRPITREHTLSLKDGIHTRQVTKFPIFDSDHELVGLGGFATDITERKRAEQALIESEAAAAAARAQLAEAIESISEGFVWFVSDERLVLFNSKFVDYTRELADLIVPGARFEDLLRAGVAQGIFHETLGANEDWIERRLERHRNPGHLSSNVAPMAAGYRFPSARPPTAGRSASAPTSPGSRRSSRSSCADSALRPWGS